MSTVAGRAFSAELRAALHVHGASLRGKEPGLRSHPDPRTACREYLFTLHTIIRASVPLMVDAIAHASGPAAAGDPIAAGTVGYLAAHVPEEEAHDEWLLDDLTHTGWSRDEILARAPSPTVAALVGAQYYWIRHHHPVALLGYIAVLEGDPPSGSMVDDLERRSGYPPEVFRTLRHHTDVDPGHQADLDAAFDSLELDRAGRELVLTSALQTLTLANAALAGALGAPGGR